MVVSQVEVARNLSIESFRVIRTTVVPSIELLRVLRTIEVLRDSYSDHGPMSVQEPVKGNQSDVTQLINYFINRINFAFVTFPRNVVCTFLKNFDSKN